MKSHVLPLLFGFILFGSLGHAGAGHAAAHDGQSANAPVPPRAAPMPHQLRTDAVAPGEGMEPLPAFVPDAGEACVGQVRSGVCAWAT